MWDKLTLLAAEGEYRHFRVSAAMLLSVETLFFYIFY